jgi:hypothetical protein
VPVPRVSSHYESTNARYTCLHTTETDPLFQCCSFLSSAKLSDHFFELQTYGIPTQVLPFDEATGTPTVVYHRAVWMERQRHQEKSSQQELGSTVIAMEQQRRAVVVPRRFDVLFGKGAIIAQHTGNLRALHIVEMNRKLYESVDRNEKTRVAQSIVDLINTSYGRFLKEEGKSGWQEVENHVAREKISHYFRRLREMDPIQKKVALRQLRTKYSESAGGQKDRPADTAQRTSHCHVHDGSTVVSMIRTDEDGSTTTSTLSNATTDDAGRKRNRQP